MRKFLMAAVSFILLLSCAACTQKNNPGEIAKTGLAAADSYLDAEISLQDAYAQISLCLEEAKACANENAKEDILVIASLAGLKEYFSCAEQGINCYNSYEITQARNRLADTLGETLREEYVKSK